MEFLEGLPKTFATGAAGYREKPPPSREADMRKLGKANLREPSEEVAAKQLVTETHRIVSPADAARQAALRRNETRWLWYVRLVVSTYADS